MVFTVGSFFRSEEPADPAVEPVTADGGVFVEWKLDSYGSVFSNEPEPEPECAWNNGSVVYESDFCDHFSLSRLASSSAIRALDRATRCSALHETECVLSPEVGVSLPAAFLPEKDGVGLRMIVAPRIINASDEWLVRLKPPGASGELRKLLMNRTVEAEYLPGGSRKPTTEIFHGQDAFCVQLLRKSYVGECWEQID